MSRLLVSFVSGSLFSVGLALSGMLKPANIVGFMDFFGPWDPLLAFTMAGALLVAAPGLYLARVHRRRAQLPAPGIRKGLTTRLLVGSTLFGVGWALAGYCPAPALTTLGAATPSAVGFVLAMAVGAYLFELSQRPAPKPLEALRER